MTRRGWGLLVAAVVCFLVARLLGVPELQVAALTILLVLGGAALLVWTAGSRLTVDRTVTPGTVWFDQQATVQLTISNVAPVPSSPAHLVDAVPSGFGGHAHLRVGALPPEGRVSATYRLRGAQRGTATIGPLEARTGDPFGCFSRTITLPSTSTLTVYPPVVRVPHGLPLGGATSSGRLGRRRLTPDGEDLADVREYVHGDDLRSVHWASTARRGKLMVRRAETATAPRAVVLLDVRAERHVGAGPAASIESAVAAAASAAHHLASRGRAVVLLDAPLRTAARPEPWERLLTRLADVEPGPSDLPATLQQLAQGLAGDGTLVAVLTTPTGSELRALVRAGRGFTTRVALVVDAHSHGRRGPDAAAEDAVAALRVAGFRATLLRRGDRIDDRWRELLTQRRGTPAGVGA